jgi:predicted NBD/HSP70 family sugar kinase
VSRKHRSVIGVDLGGTKCDVARYTIDTWEEEARERIATEAGRGFHDVLGDVIRLVQQLQTDSTEAVGVGIPGLVRHPDGMLLRAPNIPHSENVAVTQTLHHALLLPVFSANDARCFTLAEAMLGAGKGKDVVIGITMGTGVGGGIVVGGKLLLGEHGFAGEIGHMLLRPGEPPYPTKDSRGDVEQFLSGTAMGHRCEAAKRPEDYLEGQVCSFLQPAIFREAAWLITNLTHLLDPSIIVLGGSAGRALGTHLKDVHVELKRWMLPGTPLPEIAVARRKDAGTVGAALLTQK